MILDEKMLLNPPPPYQLPSSHPVDADGETASIMIDGSNNPYAAYLSVRQPVRSRPLFSSLPSHLLLQIVYRTFPQEDGQFEGDVKAVLQRRMLYWLETSLRLVSRSLYIACMHILRSTYLPSYDSLIRPPYSSDPFPSSNSVCLFGSSSSRRNSPYNSSSSLFPQHRELQTLDLFIAVLAHEELLYDTSSLHLSRQEAYKDIFDLRQPRSRLEDLVAKEGVKAGLVTLGDGDSIPGTPTTQTLSEAKGKENSLYSMSSGSNYSGLVISPSASTSTLSGPLKKAKSSFSLLSVFSSKGKGKGKALTEQPSPQHIRRTVELSPVPFGSLTVSFSTRKVSLVYTPVSSCTSKSSLTVTGSSYSAYGGSTYGTLGVSYNSRSRKRTIAEVQRDRDEALEVSARRLMRGLREWLEEEAQQ
ncbi:hypothetical protein J3R30DRAFT_930831 [Lentinula aciculospora]|uniref:Uncharacterized protein n=1 Tax=Lentinula aciculospora TaxID=153920 RepID=A0A9W9AQQ8_9AGAR|nr:hypothetical protein J3R30DRAFT_930831 [Lentinula aciculospora]